MSPAADGQPPRGGADPGTGADRVRGGGEVAFSRLAGRATGRWWRRHGPQVRQVTDPLHDRWITGMAYLWFVAYMWVGLLLAVAARQLTDVNSPYVLAVAVGGGGALGYWQARHRLRRHADPSIAPLQRFGLALCAWLGVIGLALILAAR